MKSEFIKFPSPTSCFVFHCLSKLQQGSGVGGGSRCGGLLSRVMALLGSLLGPWELVQTDLGSRCGPSIPRASLRTVCSAGAAAWVEGE